MFRNATPLEELWVEKGAGEPSAEGPHRNTIGDGYEWAGESSTYAHPAFAAGETPLIMMELRLDRVLENI